MQFDRARNLGRRNRLQQHGHVRRVVPDDERRRGTGRHDAQNALRHGRELRDGRLAVAGLATGAFSLVPALATVPAWVAMGALTLLGMADVWIRYLALSRRAA